MTPIREWNYILDKWCPVIVVLLIYGLLLVPRIIVMLLLPADSIYTWHKLHKVRLFWGFE